MPTNVIVGWKSKEKKAAFEEFLNRYNERLKGYNEIYNGYMKS